MFLKIIDFVSFRLQISAENRGSSRFFLKFLLGGYNHKLEKAAWNYKKDLIELTYYYQIEATYKKCSIRNNWHTISN